MRESGFIKSIIIIVLALIALSYAGVDVMSVIWSEEVRGTVQSIWETSLSWYSEYVVPAWSSYIKDGLLFLWNELVLNIIWENGKDIVRPFEGGV